MCDRSVGQTVLSLVPIGSSLHVLVVVAVISYFQHVRLSCVTRVRQHQAAMNDIEEEVDRDEFALTFKRGDKFIVPHKANNDDIIGNRDCCHARMTVDRLNKLKQMSLDRTEGVCWK